MMMGATGIMAFVVGATKQERATDVDEQANASDADCFIKMNCQWSEESPGGFAGHQQRHDRKHNGAGESAEDTDFSGAETKLLIRGVPPRKIIGDRGDQKRSHMRAHVPAVGQQRHRVRKKAGRNFDYHHHPSDGDDDTGSAFAFREVAHEIVRMAETGMLGPVHLPEDSAIIATSAKKPRNWSTINLDEAERELVHSRPRRSVALRRCKQSPRRRASPTNRRETVQRPRRQVR